MRARHRHFNARDAGAALCLDARYISGVSIGGAVSTWPDRSRNAYDATQTTSANRPTLEDGPAVRTNGSSHFMVIPTGPTINTGVGHCVLITVKQIAFGNSSFPDIVNIKTNESNNWQAAFAVSGQTSYRWLLSGSAVSFARLRWDVSSNTNKQIVAFQYNGSGAGTSGNTSLKVDGNTKSLTSASSFSEVTHEARIGRANNNYGNNDYHQIALLNFDVANPLRKRLEHAAAYSFKISCN
jgi:hypothetical protein